MSNPETQIPMQRVLNAVARQRETALTNLAVAEAHIDTLSEALDRAVSEVANLTQQRANLEAALLDKQNVS